MLEWEMTHPTTSPGLEKLAPPAARELQGSASFVRVRPHRRAGGGIVPAMTGAANTEHTRDCDRDASECTDPGQDLQRNQERLRGGRNRGTDLGLRLPSSVRLSCR